MNWHVYIIRASDDSLYTGITTDVERRFQEHQQASSGIKGGRGAKFLWQAAGRHCLSGDRPRQAQCFTA
ncbi:MAG: GIY-YIG nuclease family protein [Porticoccaceae bacterium]